jgi:serine/threonine-protein kinase
MPEITQQLKTALADRYVVERELGAGGMATVYLAHDVKHERKVALKVLRPELAAVIGAERFLAEIKVTANLQHPHILPLHDSGEAGSFLYYVMPYVEGETLRDKLDREKQLGIEEAVEITRSVAAALDYAHRHDVIHRDIKPENILIHDGQPTVADFGIALAVSHAGGARLTETGLSIGTPHYMSPEQAMGDRELDARSDVYSLGAMLYEMLTGDPPYTGSTAQAIVAKVLTEKAPLATVARPTTPPHVAGAIQKALEKLPADRFGSAADFAEVLIRPGAMASLAVTAADTAVATPQPALDRRFITAAAVAVLAIVAALWGWLGRADAAPGRVARHLVVLADSVGLRSGANGPMFAMSPDGSRVVFVSDEGEGMLWVRRMDDVRPQPLLGTEGAGWPTFSPDGRWIAFIRGNRLEKIRTDGGATVTLADSANNAIGGIAWLDSDSLVFVDVGFGLRKVSAAGGALSEWLTPATGRGEVMPTPLPGSRGVIYLSCTSNCVDAEIRVLDFQSGQVRLLATNTLRAWYLPTGHVLFVRRDGAALAAPFDLSTLELTGTPVPVFENVEILTLYPQLAVSDNGTLLYTSGASASALQLSVVRVDRTGQVVQIDTTWRGPFNSFSLSPDGRSLAVGTETGTSRDIWIKQLDHGPFTRLTFSGQDRRPTWSPDGRMVAFVRDTLTGGDVYGKQADGSGPDMVLASTERLIQAVEWSADGNWLILRTDNADEGRGDILGVHLAGDNEVVPLVTSPYEELQPALSPDIRWIAYVSNESGQQEVYVRPFPETASGRWQISINGGTHPRWAPDGRELYYLLPDRTLMAARIDAGATFTVLDREPLFALDQSIATDAWHTSYELTPDGRQFVFISAPAMVAGAESGGRLVLVENWFTELKERLGS